MYFEETHAYELNDDWFSYAKTKENTYLLFPKLL